MTKDMALKNLIHKDEKRLFILALIVSTIIYVSLLFYIEGLTVLLLLTIASLFSNGLMVGRIRNNGVRLSDNQFAEVYNRVLDICNAMEIKHIPEIYVIESGGLLNAFATKTFKKNIVILYSDIFDLINSGKNDELSFIIAHELAHVKRRHVAKHMFILPAMWIPSLGNAYLRACEYTSDRIAAFYINNLEASMNALTILAIGKTLYDKVNRNEYLQQNKNEKGLFNKLAEKSSTHPSLPKRINEIRYFFDNSYTPVKQHNIKSLLSSAAVVVAVAVIAFLGIKFSNDIFMLTDNLISDVFTDVDEDTTTMIEAVADDDIDKVKELLNAGVYPDVIDMDGWTPLMWAAHNGNLEIINILIEAGADPNMIDNYEETALIKAIYNNNIDVINVLLQSGAEVDMVDYSGRTPLIYAAINGHLESVQALIDAGADTNHMDTFNSNAFLYAKKYGYNEIADLLKQQ